MKNKTLPHVSVSLLALAASMNLASAAPVTWDANAATALQTDGGGVWLTANQWWNGSANVNWTSGDDAIFGNAGAGGAVTLASPTTANSITFNSFTGTYTIGTAGQAITLNNGITKNTGSGIAAIISPITMGAAQSWTNNSVGLLTVGTGAVTNGGFLLTLAGTGNTTVSSVISGAGGLTKTDAGIATLSGANTYSGATTINGGVVAASSLANGGATSSIGNSSSAASNLVFGAPTATLRYTGAAASTDRGFTLSSGAGGGATIEASGTGTLTLAATTAIAYGATNETRTLTLGGTNIEANTFAKVLADNGSGVTSFVKNGAGQWALTGANTYTGGSTVNAGTLTFRNLASKASTGTHAFAAGSTLGLGVGAGAFATTDIDNAFTGTMTGNLSNVTVNATTNIGIDTTLANLTYSSNIGATSRGLAKLGTNTLTLGANNAYTGVTTLAGGILNVGTLANAGSNSSIGNFASAGETGLVLGGDGTFNYTGGSTTTNRGFTATGASRKIIAVGTGVNLVLGDSLKNESAGGAFGLSFSASGAGSSITISSMTIAAGTSADFNLIGGFNSNVTIQNLNVTGSNVIHERTNIYNLNIGNINGTGASGWLGNVNVTGTISGYTGTIFLGGGSTNFTGLSSFNASITVQNSGIYSFNSIKNVSGGNSALGAPITVANGTIGFGNGTSTPTLRYTGTGDVTDRVLNLTGSGGTMTLEQAGTGLLRFTSATTATTGGTKTFVLSGSTAGTGEMAGAIVNGSGTTVLTKSGTGTWTLSGANTYTGATTVSAGKLIVNGSIATSSLTTVASGATIGGAGTTGALTVSLGGFINPGNSPGILNVVGNYTQAGLYTAEINGLTAGTQHDQINVTGAVNIGGGSLVAALSGAYTDGNLIFILLNDGADAITGTYAGLIDGATVTSYGGYNMIISYSANSAANTFTGGNDIALQAVLIPEPSAVLLSSLGVLLLFRRRR